MATPRAFIVYVHGGGWVLGGVQSSDAHLRHLAKETGCAVICVDYRLAPEYPFPAGLDDVEASVRWADRSMASFFGHRMAIIICGDSAGANLATVVAAKLGREKQIPIKLQILAYPVTNSDFETASYREDGKQLLLEREDMIWFWNH